MRFFGKLGWILFATTAVTSLAFGQEQRPQPFDVLIRGGKIVDGTGNPWFLGDVAIRGDRIEAVGPLRSRYGRAPRDRREGPDRRPRVHRHALAFGHDAPRGRLRPEQDPPGSDDRDPGRGYLGRPGQGEAAAELREARRRHAHLDDAGGLLRCTRTPGHRRQCRQLRRAGHTAGVRAGTIARPPRRRSVSKR